MKKILAILLAFSMLFAFAACGGNTEEPTEPTTTEDIFAGLEDEITEAVAADVTEAADADATEEAPAADATEAPAADDATDAASEDASAADTTAVEETEASKGLTSTNIEEVVAYYNAAVVKTDEAGKTPGQQTMKLASEITGDGVLGAVLSVAQPIIEDTLAKNSTATDDIPGRGTLKASDVTKAVASSKNGKTTIAIQLKEQVDGPDAPNGTDTGPVARGIGTLGNIDGALDALGATISEGRETVKLTYRDATIQCVIDEETGKITSGTWKHNIDVDIADAKIKLGVNINAKNLHTVIAYQVVV